MSIRTRDYLLTGAAALCGTVGALKAQAPATPADAVIRAETRLVLVDAVAVDKKGKFATDLADRNFKIWEDGKEQKISSFSLESAGVSPERSKKHYIAMFFDSSTSGPAGQLVAGQESGRFVDGFASPDRYMAVVNYNYDSGARVAQNFTTDGAAVKKALSTIQGSTGANPVLAQVGSTKTSSPSSPAAPVVTAATYRTMLASLRNVLDSLAAIRGRKALVFYTGSASVTGSVGPDLAATVEAANRANVAIFTVGGGPGSASSRATSSASSSTAPSNKPAKGGAGNPLAGDEQPMTGGLNDDQSIPRTLSEGTGGVSIVTLNDLANALGRVAAEQDQYYLIGYTPTTDSAEGTCHDLRLKVDRNDLEVRSRTRYCTAKPADILSGKPAGKDLETRAASGGAGNMQASLQAPWFYSEANVARVRIAMDVMPTGVKFQKDKNKLHGEFDLAAVASKPDGSVAARFSDIVKLDFDNQQQADAFLRTPYHYENQLDVAPGQYNLRMIVGAGDQGFGKAEAPLKIDPWNGQTLSASGIALSRNAHASADLTAELDGSLLERSRPLVANGTEVSPAGSSQFHAGERGFFYVEAYEPLLAAAKAGGPMPVVGLKIRVLDRATGQPKQDSGVKTVQGFMRPGSPVVPIVSPLPAMPAGAYRLEVTVMRQVGDPVVRTTDFDVN